MKTIRDRLINWAWWSCGGPAKGRHSMTAFVCDRMRSAAQGALHTPTGGGDRMDNADAALVERAWKTLLPRHRDLLRWYYIRNATPEFICRRMGFRVRPTSVFNIELARSEEEIARVLAELVSREAGSGGHRRAI